MGKALMKWTDEIDEHLRTLAKQRMSFAQAAKEISAKFKVVASRNSIAGRASRLKIEFLGKVGKRPKLEKKIIHEPVQEPKSNLGFANISLTAEQKEEGRTSFLNPEARSLRFMDLRAKHCRYPIGDTRDDTLRFCGADVKAGRSTPYCEYCYPLVYNPVGAKEKRLIKCLSKTK